ELSDLGGANDLGPRIKELADQYGLSAREVDARVKASSTLTRLLSDARHARQFLVQLDFDLRRAWADREIARLPDNPQGKALKQVLEASKVIANASSVE